MRSTDDLHPAEPWRPLGEKVTRAPAPLPSAPSPAPRGEYGIVTGKDGRVSTTTIPKV